MNSKLSEHDRIKAACLYIAQQWNLPDTDSYKDDYITQRNHIRDEFGFDGHNIEQLFDRAKELRARDYGDEPVSLGESIKNGSDTAGLSMIANYLNRYSAGQMMAGEDTSISVYEYLRNATGDASINKDNILDIHEPEITGSSVVDSKKAAEVVSKDSNEYRYQKGLLIFDGLTELYTRIATGDASKYKDNLLAARAGLVKLHDDIRDNKDNILDIHEPEITGSPVIDSEKAAEVVSKDSNEYRYQKALYVHAGLMELDPNMKTLKDRMHSSHAIALSQLFDEKVEKGEITLERLPESDNVLMTMSSYRKAYDMIHPGTDRGLVENDFHVKLALGQINGFEKQPLGYAMDTIKEDLKAKIERDGLSEISEADMSNPNDVRVRMAIAREANMEKEPKQNSLFSSMMSKIHENADKADQHNKESDMNSVDVTSSW